MGDFGLPLEIIKYGFEYNYKKNNVIFSQGEIADKVFYLKNGRVRFSFYDEEKRHILYYAGNHEFLGIESFIANKDCYDIDAEAVCDCLIVVFSKEIFKEVLFKDPKYVNYFLFLVSKRFLSLVERAKSLCFLDCHKRIISTLLWLTKQNDLNNFIVRLSHEELGELSNVHRVTVTKVLKKLEDSNAIQKKFKTIIVTPERRKKLNNLIF